MAKVEALEEELVELKLKKRNFILDNKDTKEIDNLIKNLEEEIRPVDDTQIGDTITEDSVNDENVNEDTTTSEEKQVSDDTNTNSSTMDSETITN